MAKQTMEGRRFAKRQFAVCAGLTAGAAALNGWLLLREATGKQPVSTLLSLEAVCVLLILLGQLWAWVPGDGPEFEKGHYGPEYSPIDHHLNSGQRGLPSGTAVHLRTGGIRLGAPAVSPSLWGGGAAL